METVILPVSTLMSAHGDAAVTIVDEERAAYRIFVGPLYHLGKAEHSVIISPLPSSLPLSVSIISSREY